MNTIKGAVMSPRMERLWTFIKGQKIPLTDWSTDECVQRYMGQLQKALQLIQDARTSGAWADWTAIQIDHLEADLCAIMRRVPENRVSRWPIAG